MKNAVIIGCNNKYVPKAIIALTQFTEYNIDYEKFIIGTTFTETMKLLCKKYNVGVIEVNLYADFINLSRRPNKKYPIECFYHLYAYKILHNYDYIISIEPDIYTNKAINNDDLMSIKYTGGSSIKNRTIGNMFENIYNGDAYLSGLQNKYGKITPENLSTNRIIGGVKIYNVEGLKSINFYEVIVEYYKYSWKLNSPRCGDDTLFVLYQLLNPSHVKILNPEFHVIIHNRFPIIFNNTDYLNDITFVHFAQHKYWKILHPSKLKKLSRYFYDSNMEFIYNNFPISFIEQYVPEIYINITNIQIPFYYYKHGDNFGDLITPYFLNKYCNNKEYAFDFNVETSKIISCGSIMRLCNDKSIVYGSGIRDIDQNIKKGVIKIVRGPLTRKRLSEINCYCPPVYGDPGLLLSLYYNPTIKKTHKLGIIPHHIHYKVVKEMYKDQNIKVINLVNKNIEPVIDEILSCEKIISSSLHGLIVSDSYNIPNKWVKFNNKINGDDTKYRDYFQSVKRKEEYIDCMNYKFIPDNTYDDIKDVNIKFDFLNLKKKMFFDEKGIKNYTKYLYAKTKQTKQTKQTKHIVHNIPNRIQNNKNFKKFNFLQAKS